MTVTIFALSFQSGAEAFPGFADRPLSGGQDSALLAGMTRIFRQAFRSIFARVATFQGERLALETPDARITLIDAAILASSTEFAVDGDREEYLLVALVDIVPVDPEADTHALWRARYPNPGDKLALAAALGLGAALDQLKPGPGRLPGQASTPLKFQLEERKTPVLMIFAFYAMGWLQAMRIERTQLAMRLEAVSDANIESGIAIANQRLRILNQQRFFLTHDRTNDLDLRGLCVAMVAKFKLVERIGRSLELHGAFEHHLDNATKLYSAGRLGSVSTLITLLTILSVPISVFSAIFAINMKSEAVENLRGVAADYRIYVTLGIAALAVALPFYAIRLYDRMIRR